MNAWLQPGADAYHTSCFRQLPTGQPTKPKPLERLRTCTLHYIGLKAGVNEIEGFTRKRDS